MNDPFTPPWDLAWRNPTPYTDNDGGHDPAMPAAHFLPRRDPKPSIISVDPGQVRTEDSNTLFPLQGIIPAPDVASQKLHNDPSGPSAALLDPSAFQPQTDPRVLTPPPPGAITLATTNASNFAVGVYMNAAGFFVAANGGSWETLCADA